VNGFTLNSRNRRLLLALVFGIVPSIFYMALIHPAVDRISKYRDAMKVRANEVPSAEMDVSPASTNEFEQLQKIKKDRLYRVKKINSRESLLRFSGALADALAAQARLLGLQVREVILANSSINGKYIPASQRAVEMLNGLPGPQWGDLSDPLDLPLLKLPSIEVRMTLIANHTQMFSFVESLPDFPSLIQLTEFRTEEEPAGKIYHVRIRGYYFNPENLQQTTQLEAPSYR
jgi:hypothetical protein